MTAHQVLKQGGAGGGVVVGLLDGWRRKIISSPPRKKDKNQILMMMSSSILYNDWSLQLEVNGGKKAMLFISADFFPRPASSGDKMKIYLS